MSLSSKLSHFRVTDAKFVTGGKKGGGRMIEVRLEGAKILPAQTIQIVEHEPWIGSWWKTRNSKKILLDDDAATKDKYILSLAIHEVVEKWVYETFFKGTPISKVYSTCHRTAQNLERTYHQQKWGKESWKEYSKIVNKAYRKERRYEESDKAKATSR
ncbi:MAG: hypothetical protein WED04_09795 [Promethearchaeati archaeon SRVP18_Atabeyarchaeia-1]